MLHAASLFLLTLVAPPPTASELEILTRRVQAAVEAGQDSAARDEWRARLAADPHRARLALATIDRLTYRYADARRTYESLAGDAAASPAARGYAELGLAMLELQQARLTSGAPHLRRALAAFTGPDAGAARAHALLLTGIISARTVSLDSALAAYRAAERTVPAGDDWLGSLVRCNALVTRARAADPGAAPRARPEAEAALRAGNLRAAAACLAALAQDYERRTVTDSALATFDEVAELQRRARNLSSLAVTRQWQGYVMFSMGDVMRAREALDEASRLGRATSTIAAAAYAELSLADLALAFSDLGAAGSYARSAIAGFEQMGDRSGIVQARMHEGDVALLNGALPAAREAYEEAIAGARTLFPTLGVHARGRLSAVARLEGDWVAAERELDTAQAEAVRLGMDGWRFENDYERGVLALARGESRAAIARLRSVDAMLSRDASTRSDVLLRLAEAHVRLGQIDEAEREMTEAGALQDRLRRSLSPRELQAAVIGARSVDWDRDLGFATSIAGLVAADRAYAALGFVEQRRARLLLDALVRRSALSDRPAGAAEPDVLWNEAEVRRLLPDSTAVVSYLTGQGGEPTTVFILTRDRLLAVSAAAVDEHRNDLVRFTGLVAAGLEAPELARRLGDAFVQPWADSLPPGISRLVVIPDGPLHRIPFDLLRPGDGAPLIDRFAVTFAPSIAVATSWWRGPPRPPAPRLLALGDPTSVRLELDGRDSIPPRLPNAAREAREVARYAEDSEVLIGADARESLLRRAPLEEFGVVHFATHAEVAEWSLLRSALRLSPGDGEDGKLTAIELGSLRLHANLVVLSACRSAGGAVLTGEGLHGLTIPVLEAGAASVVATLWPVGDESVDPMIRFLYRELATGAPVGDALARAKRAARADGVSPAIWSAFTVTGDGRVATALRPPRRTLALLLPVLLMVVGGGYLGLRMRSRRSGERR